MSQRQFAIALGISLRALKYIESGARKSVHYRTELLFEDLQKRHLWEQVNGLGKGTTFSPVR